MPVYLATDAIQPQRILVLEDSLHLRNLIVKFLTRHGYDVHAEERGDAGEAYFRENPAELLIADVVMPGKYGTEVARDLQRDYPGLKVIVVTGNRNSERFDLEGTSAFGEFTLLPKPFQLEALLDSVRKLIGVARQSPAPTARPRQ